MLPSMQSGTASQQHRQNTKSVQMRSTMYNNSYFQKLLNNVQNVSQKVSVVDQKGGKKSSSNNLDNSSNLQTSLPDNINVMIKTSYGGNAF